jgi:hypothetical protein
MQHGVEVACKLCDFKNKSRRWSHNTLPFRGCKVLGNYDCDCRAERGKKYKHSEVTVKARNSLPSHKL